MSYHNLTTIELIREAEHEGNYLAMAMGDRLLNEIEEYRKKVEQEFEEFREELLDHYVGKLEEQLEQYNEEQLKPDSDYCTAIAELLDHSIDQNAVERVIDELEPGRELSEEHTDYLKSLDQDGLFDLAYDISTMASAATHVTVTNSPYIGVPYSLAGTPVGEEEIDLEHWVEDIPECIRRAVMDKLTGQDGGTLYYIDNSYVSVDLTMNFDWLAEWIDNRKAEAA